MFKRLSDREKYEQGASDDGHVTTIAAETVVQGDLSFAGTLIVRGSLKGTVKAEADSESMLLVEESGRIEGEIKVPIARVNGQIQGELHASKRLVLSARAEIDGDVHYERVELSEGCRINGNLRRIAAVESLAERREEREKLMPASFKDGENLHKA